MARKRRGRPIHGWLIVDKPSGMTSAAVVARVKALTGAAKAGHGGTLDPLATGVLPIALGEATKTVRFAMDGAKTYEFTIRFGEARDTDDAEGRVAATCAHRPDRAALEATFAAFTGAISQVPPVYSAIKVEGERAYALARAGGPPEMEPRTVEIRRIALIDMPDPDHARLRVDAGKGAYMRALARDLARAAGTVGHVAALRRTRVGPFGAEQAISLESLAALVHSAALAGALLPVETALDDIPALALTAVEAKQMRRGQPVPVLPVAQRSPLKAIEQGDMVWATEAGRPVALAEIKGGELRPVRVLNL